MTVLHPTPVMSDRFSWFADSKLFVAEASDLGVTSFSRVYDDACDEGLTLVSSKYPGREIVFAISHTERDRENDVLYWDLEPAVISQRKTVPFRVRIYND